MKTDERVVLKLKDAAQKLSCRSEELLKAIKTNHYNEVQGVHHIFPGDHGYRIDVQAFLNWRRYPLSAGMDARYMEVAKAFLAILMPAGTVLKQCVEEFQELYESAARRIEAGQHDYQETPPLEDGLDQDDDQ